MALQADFDKKVHKQVFRDWTSYVDFAVNAPYQVDNVRVNGLSSHSPETDSPSSWYGTETFDDAVKMARKGWPEIGEKIASRSNKMYMKIAKYIMRPEPQFRTEGHILDVGRWHDGEPEHWLVMDESEQEQIGNKLAKIIFNGSVSCGVGSNIMVARGSAVCSLIRLLDFAGIRTQLTMTYVGSSSSNNGERLITEVNLKNHDQDLDLELVAYALAHPSSFRRINFSVMEKQSPHVVQKFGIIPNSGYGYPASLIKLVEYSPDDLYIDSAMFGEVQWSNEVKAEEWVFKQLREFGVHLTIDEED